MITGKMEITIKITQLPTEIKTVTNGWKEFVVNADGQEISMTVRPKVYGKLEQAQKDYPQWVAAIAGKMGEKTAKGFVLAEATIQVFEKKPKPQESTAQPSSSNESKSQQVSRTIQSAMRKVVVRRRERSVEESVNQVNKKTKQDKNEEK